MLIRHIPPAILKLTLAPRQNQQTGTSHLDGDGSCETSCGIRVATRVRFVCCLAIALGANILMGTVADLRAGQTKPPQRTEAQQKVFALALQMDDVAFNARATPVTEPGVPAEKVERMWNIDLLRLTEDTLVVTNESAPDFKYYVQVNLCDLDGTTKFSDGTVLGASETPATFYDANYTFYVKDDLEFARCAERRMHFSVTGSALSPGKKRLYESHDRALRQLCSWLVFFNGKEESASRAADILAFILRKQKEVLLDADSARDLADLERRMDFFDRTFPFAIFDMNPLLSSEVRVQGREFFQTTLLLRRKLAALDPKQTEQIVRDEALLRRLR
jgi:hypothetical protein